MGSMNLFAVSSGGAAALQKVVMSSSGVAVEKRIRQSACKCDPPCPAPREDRTNIRKNATIS